MGQKQKKAMGMVMDKNNVMLFDGSQNRSLKNDSEYIPKDASWSMFLSIIVLVIFGMFFNETLNMENMDELLEIVFLLTFLKAFIIGRLNRKIGWDIKIIFALLIFYPIYSISLHLNTTKSIFIDLLLQMKPYIAFFTIYYLGIRLTIFQKRVLKNIIFALVFFSAISLLWVIGSIDGIDYGLYKIYGHSSKFYSGLILLGLLYLFCSEYNMKNLIIYFLIISMGLFTLKGKMFGFFFASIALTYFFKRGLELRISGKNILLISILLIGILWVAKDKMFFYFSGTSDSEHALARPLLYITSLDIIKDFFPFGSGLASFGTHASRITYSKIYYDYELDHIWGISPDMPDFIADAYYPSLAQFGVFGVILFILFWISMVRKLNEIKKSGQNEKNYLIGTLLIFFLGIELVADATYTNNRGFMVMVLLALVLNEYGSKEVKSLE